MIVLVVVTDSGVVGGRSKTGTWVLGPAGLGGAGAGSGLVNGSSSSLAESVSISNTSGSLKSVGFPCRTSRTHVVLLLVAVIATEVFTTLLVVGTALSETGSSATGRDAVGGTLERLTTSSTWFTRDKGSVWVELALASLSWGVVAELLLVGHC